MSKSIAVVYRGIIDDVVTRCRTEFVQEGVDEAVLDELRDLWEAKLLASGALNPPAAPIPQQPHLGPAPQYYSPAVAGGGYAGVPAYNPAAVGYDSQLGKPETFLQPTGLQHSYPAASAAPQPYQPPQHQYQQQPVQQQPQHAYSAAAQPALGAPAARMQAAALGQPPPLLPPGGGATSSAASGAAPSSSHVGVPQLQRLPQYPPQQQQQPQRQDPVQQQVAGQADTRKRSYAGPDQAGPSKQPYQPPAANGAVAPSIPQRDGTGDDGDDEAGPADDAFAGDDEGDDPLAGLSSDDDEEGADIPNIVLAQFEKVSRTKTKAGTKWKCQLKNGIAHLSGRDIIFKKCGGEMQF